MKYEIIDEEVQKTYYYAKKILDAQGFTHQLGIYLALGQKNQPKGFYLLGLGQPSKPFVIICFILGIILLFSKKILFGISAIITGIVVTQFFGWKMQRYLSNPSVTNPASQKSGSHKLMKIIADEMSKGASIEQIVEALKREITNQ